MPTSMPSGVVHLITDYRKRSLCGQPGPKSKVLSAVTCPACLSLPIPAPPGRRPRGDAAADIRKTVRLTQEEVDAFERASGDQPVTEWLRELGRRAAGLKR